MAGLTLVLLSTGLFGVVAHKQDQPPAEEIVGRLLARQKENKASGNEDTDHYDFKQRIVREKLNAEGLVSEHQEVLYEVSPADGILSRKLLLKNGRPPTPSDLKQEEERFKRERREAERRKRSPDDEEDVEFNEDLAAKYKYTLLGEEIIHGRPAYAIAFKPRSNDLPVRRKVDYVLNHVEGKAWVDNEDYELAKVELHLTEKTSLWLGILGTLREFNALFEQEKLAGGAWLPSHFTMRIDARILLSSLREQREGWWSDFRRVGADAATKREKASKQ